MIFLKRRALMTRASFNYKTVNGIGSAVLENCVETRFKRLSLSGNSAQGENPSIESPKEIKNSGKYDETSGKYVIDVSVTGKNLFNPKSTEYVQNTYRSYKVNKKKGISYITITLIDKENNADISGVSLGFSGDDTNATTGLTWLVSSTSIIKTKTTIAKYITIYPPRDEILEKILNRFDIQVEYGEEATEYEPYYEPQTVQLQLDEPLRGIGEYKDVVTKDGILRKIKEIVLDENTGFETYWATLNKTFAFISPTIKDATVINGTPNRLLCNYSKALPDGLDRTDEEVCVLFNRRFHIRFLKERNIDTVEKLKEWLKQNPIKIQYLLQEPVLEPFENSLDSLHANDGTTIITVDSGEVETGIEVEYAIKN